MHSFQSNNGKKKSSFLLPNKPLNDELPISKDQTTPLRRRSILSSLSLKIQPILASSSSSSFSSSPFRRSKSVSAMGEQARSSVKRWWDWSLSWILSKKPIFAKDLEMNEEETNALGSHNRGSLRHVFHKFRSEVRKLVSSSDRVGLPQTCKYNSFDYSKNFDDGVRSYGYNRIG